MLDMSWGEIMVIGGVALIVIGPKDLPKALRTVGQMTTKVRRLAGEFQAQFSEAMREAELQDVQKEMEGLKRDVATATSGGFNPIQTIRDELKGSVERPVESTHTDPVFDTVPDPIPPVEITADTGPLPETPSISNGSTEKHPPAEAVSSPSPAEDYINPEVQPPLPASSDPAGPDDFAGPHEAKR